MLYKIYNKTAEVEINSLGAEIKSFKIAGKEFMHDSNKKYWGRSAPYLFPNIGTIKDGFVEIDGKEYKFSKHGFLRDSEMEVIKQSENYISFSLKWNESTIQHFPYKFELIIDYILEDQTLTARIFVKNLDQKAIHFNFGLHPAFKVPWNDTENFEDYTIKFNKPITADLPTVLLDSGLIDWKQTYKKIENVSSIKLNHEDYSHDALCIEPYPGTPIVLESPSKESIELNAPCFKTLGIWTPYPTAAPFICLEPWYGCADNPETNHHYLNKKDLIKLEANEIWVNTYQIKINC